MSAVLHALAAGELSCWSSLPWHGVIVCAAFVEAVNFVLSGVQQPQPPAYSLSCLCLGTLGWRSCDCQAVSDRVGSKNILPCRLHTRTIRKGCGRLQVMAEVEPYYSLLDAGRGRITNQLANQGANLSVRRLRDNNVAGYRRVVNG